MIMTQEEKAKAYEEALGKAKALYGSAEPMSGCNVILETLFPELKESEDEKIKKVLIELVKCNERSGYKLLNNVSTSSMLDWLEKQGQVKESTISQHENKSYKENDDSLTSEDERIRKALLNHLTKMWGNSQDDVCGVHVEDVIAWLEKQGEQNEIFNVPSREVILSIWDLGNEWIELTKGSISTEYGTQLNYIQKHWQESEYYLRAKQSEQKPYGQRAECLDCQFNYAGECKGFCSIKKSEQKPADKVEPKFHVGEWIVSGYNNVAYIESIDETKYNLKCKDGSHEKLSIDYINRCWHLWIIQDAKDGDVLAEDVIESYSSSFVAIFKKQNGEDFDSYCFVGFNGKFYEGENGHSTEGIHPATKEQRDTLLKAMADAGYMWDSENKMLLSLKAEPNSEQKPAWSEEDEKRLRSCLNILQAKFVTETINTKWLKSLKNRLL